MSYLLFDPNLASWALINAIGPLLSASFDGAFDLLQLIRATLILKMEFLRPMLAKVELICQQPAMPQLSGVGKW